MKTSRIVLACTISLSVYMILLCAFGVPLWGALLVQNMIYVSVILGSPGINESFKHWRTRSRLPRAIIHKGK